LKALKVLSLTSNLTHLSPAIKQAIFRLSFSLARNRQTVKLTPKSSLALLGRYVSSLVDDDQTAHISLQINYQCQKAEEQNHQRSANQSTPAPAISPEILPSKPRLPAPTSRPLKRSRLR